MEGAIQILTGGDKVFEEATTTFLQLKAVQKHQSKSYGQLKALAAKYQTSGLAKLVTMMKNGGHFDKVMIEIDQMMKILRKEEQSDIQHRDRCENGQNANGNEMDDVNSDIEKTQSKMDRLDRSKTAAKEEKTTVEGEIQESDDALAKMLELRNEDHAEFVRAMKMDSEAVSLIASAIVRLSKYYKENKIPVGLVQAPEYKDDQDKAPETTFSGSGSHQGDSTGIVAILEMIKEDLQKEIKEGQADEAKAQAEYQKQSGALADSRAAQKETRVSLEKEIAGLSENLADAEKHKGDKEADLAAEENMKKSLETDCAWVQTHFGSRRDARKKEMDGLVEAKNFLAGVESGTPVLGPA